MSSVTTTSSVHLLLLLWLSCNALSVDIECTIDNKDPCKCTFLENSTTWTIDIGHYFTYPYTPKPDQDKYVYTYMCHNEECPKNPGTSAVACQYDTGQKVDTPLGKYEHNTTKWDVVSTSAKSFQFAITYTGGQDGRKTRVTFSYAKSDMAIVVTGEKNKQYTMEATGNMVKAIKSGGGGSNDISGPIGLSLIFLSIAALVAYFIVGAVYMYKMKGARGVEMVPHLNFWKDLPHLIKDGFFFTISPCYRRDGEYQQL